MTSAGRPRHLAQLGAHLAHELAHRGAFLLGGHAMRAVDAAWPWACRPRRVRLAWPAPASVLGSMPWKSSTGRHRTRTAVEPGRRSCASPGLTADCIGHGSQGRRDSNPQPPVLETGALPIEPLPSVGSGPLRPDHSTARQGVGSAVSAEDTTGLTGSNPRPGTRTGRRTHAADDEPGVRRLRRRHRRPRRAPRRGPWRWAACRRCHVRPVRRPSWESGGATSGAR